MHLLYWRVCVKPYGWFHNEKTAFIKILWSQIVQTFFLSTLIALNIKWVPRFTRIRNHLYLFAPDSMRIYANKYDLWYFCENRSELIDFQLPNRIKGNNQHSVFLMFDAGNFPHLEKPGSWLLLALPKFAESISVIVRY